MACLLPTVFTVVKLFIGMGFSSNPPVDFFLAHCALYGPGFARLPVPFPLQDLNPENDVPSPPSGTEHFFRDVASFLPPPDIPSRSTCPALASQQLPTSPSLNFSLTEVHYASVGMNDFQRLSAPVSGLCCLAS